MQYSFLPLPDQQRCLLVVSAQLVSSLTDIRRRDVCISHYMWSRWRTEAYISHLPFYFLFLTSNKKSSQPLPLQLLPTSKQDEGLYHLHHPGRNPPSLRHPHQQLHQPLLLRRSSNPLGLSHPPLHHQRKQQLLLHQQTHLLLLPKHNRILLPLRQLHLLFLLYHQLHHSISCRPSPRRPTRIRRSRRQSRLYHPSWQCWW